MPPAIMKGNTGQTYIVAGKWIPVPDGTTREDMHKYVTYEQPVYDDIKTWQIASSSGSTYTVRCYNETRYTCTCVGFKFHKKCKHVTKVKG